MIVNEKMTDEITKAYSDRFNVKVRSVQDGVEDVFRGSLVIVTYEPSIIEPVSDVVFVNKTGEPKIFETTQELVLFLRDRSKFNTFEAIIDSRMFHASVLLLLLLGVFFAGYLGEDRFGSRALAILGSVVGLAAGLFFGAEKK